MPNKRPIEIRLEEAKERVKALEDERRMNELRERIRIRRRRRR